MLTSLAERGLYIVLIFPVLSGAIAAEWIENTEKTSVQYHDLEMLWIFK